MGLKEAKIQMVQSDNKGWLEHRTLYVFHSIHLRRILCGGNSVDD